MNNPFRNNPFNNDLGLPSFDSTKEEDPFFSVSFQNKREGLPNQLNLTSEKGDDVISDLVASSSASALFNEFTVEDLKSICLLAAYNSILKGNKCNEKNIHIEVLNAVQYRRNYFEKTIYDIFNNLSHLSFEEVLPYLDKINGFFPGLINDSIKDEEAAKHSDEFIEEIILSSSSETEWLSIYKNNDEVKEWIKNTSDRIINVISTNFCKTSYTLDNLKPDQVCKLLSSLFIIVNDSFLPIMNHFDIDPNITEDGLRTIRGIVINGLCHIRDGIFSNICRKILINRTPEERDALIKQFDEFTSIGVKLYNLPKGEEFTFITALIQQMLHYRKKVSTLMTNAKKFLDLENLLSKLDNFDKKLEESEYLKNFPSSPNLRESLTLFGEIIFFLDSDFSPLKIIHFNGRQHYTQFVFDSDDKNSTALVVTGNINKKCFDKTLINSSYEVYLDSCDNIHAVYDERFASLPTDDWYQKLNNIMIKIDKNFRKIIFNEWQNNPSLYANLHTRNALVYFLVQNEIISVTDNTFPEDSLENREVVNMEFPKSDTPLILKNLFPRGCTFSKYGSNDIIEEKEEGNKTSNSEIVKLEDIAWKEIISSLPENGKINWDWLRPRLEALGELEHNRERGKGSHSILKINGYNGSYTLSKKMREQLEDTGYDPKFLVHLLQSIMKEKYSLVTFINAIKEKDDKL